MFRTEIIRLLFVIPLVFLTPDHVLYGQVAEHDLPAVKARAMDRFESGEYALAAPDMARLSRQFPKDPMYRYYLGVCKVEMDQDLEEAVEMLWFASARGVPADVHYYLGEAYRKLYDFMKAKDQYIAFDREASRSEAREYQSKLLIRAAAAAMDITASYNPYELLDITFLDLETREQYGQLKMKGGHLSRKPEEFFEEGELQEGLHELMFMPDKVARGQVVYFSAWDKRGRNGYQVMQATRGNMGKWTDIRSVDALNTGQNEILPYFDPVGKDIYFASDGREGLGGFDLYRSHFDEERGEWSEPVNLGFPVNSVMDDYIFLPGEDLGRVTIVSGRQTSDGAPAMFMVDFSEPRHSLATSTPEEIRRIANLGFTTLEPRPVKEAMTALSGENIDEAESPEVTGGKQEDHVGQTAETPGNDSQQEPHDALQQLIAHALGHQQDSDSLSRLALSARARARYEEDTAERSQLQQQILVWERLAESEQAKADGYFRRLEEQGSPDTLSANENLPGVIEEDTVINEMTVYRYVDEQPVDEKARTAFKGPAAGKENAADTEKPSAQEQEKGNVTDVQAGKAKERPTAGVLREFRILPEPPYTVDQPIPVDAAIPSGTFYRIQLGVYSRVLEPGTFGGLWPVSAETLPERELVKYFAGRFSRYEDARAALPEIRAAGYRDAFVVAWYNGRVIAFEKARKLEK